MNAGANSARAKRIRLAVVVAAYNEDDKIGVTINSLRTAFTTGSPDIEFFEVAVVNDGSTDNTGKAATDAGAFVLDLNRNVGKGAALNALIKARYLLDAPDLFLFLDADLAETAKDAAVLLEPLITKEADLCVAIFPRPTVKGGFGLVKGLARKAIRRRTGFLSNEPLSGQRAMTKEVLHAVYPLGSGFGVEVKMTLDALEKGFRIKEVPVPLAHRHSSRSLAGFRHRGSQFFDVLKVLIFRVSC